MWPVPPNTLSVGVEDAPYVLSRSNASPLAEQFYLSSSSVGLPAHGIQERRWSRLESTASLKAGQWGSSEDHGASVLRRMQGLEGGITVNTSQQLRWRRHWALLTAGKDARGLYRNTVSARATRFLQRAQYKAPLPVLKCHDRAMAAWVFGSTGTGHATAMSDLDLAVLIDGDISLMEELSLSADLAVALGRDDVDLLVLNSARNDLQHAVMSQGEIIYDRIL